MSHGGHDGSSDGLECQVEMLWNWNTMDLCVLSHTWHVRTIGMMVASVVGVALLAVLLELCRRTGRDYDTHLASHFRRSANSAIASNAEILQRVSPSAGGDASPMVITMRASPLQQAVRATIHATTFAVAYMLMLIVMSFNGYIVVAVFVGAGLGKFLTDWMEVKVPIARGKGAGQEWQKGEMESVTYCCA